MQFLRKFLLVLIAPVFMFLLYATAVSWGFVQTGTHPETIKKIISDSGVYGSVINGLLDQGKTISNQGQDVSLKNSIVRNAAQRTFTPQLIQTDTETVIDSVYRWLDGKTPIPDFQIDLSAQKAQFASRVAAAAQKRAAKLPKCSGPVDLSNVDPLTIKCLPPGVNPATEAAALKQSILSGEGFLDHPVITADSIKSTDPVCSNSQSGAFPCSDNKQSKSFFSEHSNLPKHYQTIKKLPYGLAFLALLFALVIVLLSSSRRAGVRRVGITLAIVGVVMLIFAWGINKAVNDKAIPKIKLNNAVLEAKVKTLVSDITERVDKNVGSSRVDLQACKLEYSIVSPK